MSGRRRIEFGIMTNLHYTTYEEVRAIWQTAEQEGLDHAWAPDHLLPAFSDLGGTTLEAWTTLTDSCTKCRGSARGFWCRVTRFVTPRC